MKAIKPFIILLSLFLAVYACEKEKEFNLKPGDIFSIDNSCFSVCYQSRIGTDSASAVDSIKRFYERNRPELLADSIQPQRLNVDFPHDNRLFWLLPVREKNPSFPLPVVFDFDAVDSRGNHYTYLACPD